MVLHHRLHQAVLLDHRRQCHRRRQPGQGSMQLLRQMQEDSIKLMHLLADTASPLSDCTVLGMSPTGLKQQWVKLIAASTGEGGRSRAPAGLLTQTCLAVTWPKAVAAAAEMHAIRLCLIAWVPLQTHNNKGVEMSLRAQTQLVGWVSCLAVALLLVVATHAQAGLMGPLALLGPLGLMGPLGLVMPATAPVLLPIGSAMNLCLWVLATLLMVANTHAGRTLALVVLAAAATILLSMDSTVVAQMMVV